MKSKAFFAGVGSGAGVAWPVFGIMHSAFSIPIAGTGALILGAGSITAFFVVALPIALIYYHELKKNQREQEKTYDEKINKLISLKELINSKNLVTANKTQSEIWRMQAEVKIKRSIDLELKKNTTPLKKILPPAFGAFVSTFGSIVGCSAGVSGLLTGMGLFTSFAAFPYLGAGIVICAAVISAVMIIKSIQETKRNHKNDLRLEKIKSLIQEAKTDYTTLSMQKIIYVPENELNSENLESNIIDIKDNTNTHSIKRRVNIGNNSESFFHNPLSINISLINANSTKEGSSKKFN